VHCINIDQHDESKAAGEQPQYKSSTKEQQKVKYVDDKATSI